MPSGAVHTNRRPVTRYFPERVYVRLINGSRRRNHPSLFIRETLLYRGGVVSSFFITACSLFQSRRTSLARFSLLSEVGAMAAT
jgi:hypothetical protein